MKKIFILLILLIFTVHCAPEKNQITITILYDNYAFIEDVKTEWGFSCIIEGTEKTILFDTGTIADTLFYNIDKLNVNPEKVELVVISHIHNDHTGGLLPFLEKNNRVSVYMPVSFPDEFVGKVLKAF